MANRKLSAICTVGNHGIASRPSMLRRMARLRWQTHDRNARSRHREFLQFAYRPRGAGCRTSVRPRQPHSTSPGGQDGPNWQILPLWYRSCTYLFSGHFVPSPLQRRKRMESLRLHFPAFQSPAALRTDRLNFVILSVAGCKSYKFPSGMEAD